MFEKEAEEMAEEYYYKTYPVTLNIGEEERKKEVTDIFLAGYNKANEWHYVKDGNPDNENDILCLISKDEVVVGYHHTKEKRYFTTDGQNIEVIAWKEIVLPKEKE